jgi:hypothetical protein
MASDALTFTPVEFTLGFIHYHRQISLNQQFSYFAGASSSCWLNGYHYSLLAIKIVAYARFILGCRDMSI